LFCGATSPKGGPFVLQPRRFTAIRSTAYTLKPAVIDIVKNTGLEVRRIRVDAGYRGHNYPNRFRDFVIRQIKTEMWSHLRRGIAAGVPTD
jgi:transposase, IS5 family